MASLGQTRAKIKGCSEAGRWQVRKAGGWGKAAALGGSEQPVPLRPPRGTGLGGTGLERVEGR